MHYLPDVLGDLQLVINDDLVQRDQCEPEPEVVRQLYVLERVLPRELKVVARAVPIRIEYNKPCNQSEADVLLGVGELVVDQDHGEEGDVPEKVLGGDDFVEHHEYGGLHEHHEEEVVIEGETGDDHQTPLREEGKDGQDGGGLVLEELIDHVEVDREVVSMVLPLEVVEQGFVEALVTVLHIEQVGKAQKGRGGNDGEHKLVPRDQRVLEGLPSFACLDQLMVAVDVEIEGNRVDDRVDLEMHTQAIEEGR